MNNKTKGAWLINHTMKLQNFKDATAFEDIETAGKCGIFLSGLTASDLEIEISPEKVKAVAAVAGIKKTEISNIINLLKDQSYIDTTSKGGIVTIGITTSSILGHTATIYENNEHDRFQDAAILLSEKVSEVPQYEYEVKELISDEMKLSTKEADDLFHQAEFIGLVDSEDVKKEKVIFNGNLYRRDDLNKANAVLNSLKSEERGHILEVDELLRTGCITKETAERILGENLLTKLHSIGLYDISIVNNDKGKMAFVTKPSAFAKFGNPFEEDALDLAKAFVASLAYGMIISDPERGKIQMLRALLLKLLRGEPIGSAPAIGQDYKYLELRNVVKVEAASGGRYFMTLLKKEIGVIALQVLQSGDASEQSILKSLSNTITGYTDPETTRAITRKNQSVESKLQSANLLKTFRGK